MKRLYVAVYMLILALAGCDNNDNTPTTVKKDTLSEVTRATSSGNTSSAKLSVPGGQELAQQSTGKVLTLLDLSEVQLDSAATPVLVFFIPLDPDRDFSHAIHVADKKNGKVGGAQELSDNSKELCLRHLEPERDLTVTIGKEVKALNSATFSKDYEKTMTTRDAQPSVGFTSRDSLLPDKVVEGLPVMAPSVNNVDVNFFHVKPESLPAFISQWEYRNSLANWQSDKLLRMANLVYTERLDLGLARNIYGKSLLPPGDIKPLQQTGVYLAVMNQAGRYDYNSPATLFMLGGIDASAHRYHNRLDVSIQSLENGAVRQGTGVSLLNEKGQTLTQVTSDTQGHVQLEDDKNAALLLARKDSQTTLFDLKLPVPDLAESNTTSAPGYNKQFFMFGLRDLYRPGETIIPSGLLCDADGEALPNQPIKLDATKSDGQVLRSIASQPENGLYHFTWPLDSNAATGMQRIRASTDDNQHRVWGFHVEGFISEHITSNLIDEKTPLMPKDEVKFSVVGYYLYGAPANGNTLQEQLFLRPLREAVSALPGFEFGNIAAKNLSRMLDGAQLTLDGKGRGGVSTENQWKETHSPLQVIFQGSLLESGGRPVTRRAEQAIWPADALPGIRPQFALKPVYDYRTNSTVKQPTADEGSNAVFDIIYNDA